MRPSSFADLAGARPRVDAAAELTGSGQAASARTPRFWTAIAESVALGLLLPAIGWLVDHHDPFFETRSFSWYVLPPLLAGLRHGFAAGCASATALAAAMLVGWRLHVFGGATSPGEALIGMFTTAMVTGHVSDVWLRETVRMRAAFDHARRRANEIARAHFLLQLSHERLQEQSPGVANLREALDRIAEGAAPSDTDWSAVAQQVVALAARFTSVEAATLIQTDAAGNLGAVLATLGEPGPVPADDPILRDALRAREIAAVAGASASAAALRPPEASRLLAVIPVIDAGGILHGVLCVEAMPFFAFTRRNLEALAVLVGHFADRVSADGNLAEPHREREKAFLQRLDGALAACREGSEKAVLGVLAVVAGSPLHGITDIIVSGILAPEHVVHRTRGRAGDTLIWLLLPGASEAEVHAMVARIEDLTQQELERDLAAAGGTAAFRFLTPADERAAVMGELEQELEARRGRR